MKFLLVIAVVVFYSVYDLLFRGGAHVHVFLDWVQTNASWMQDQARDIIGY